MIRSVVLAPPIEPLARRAHGVGNGIFRGTGHPHRPAGFPAHGAGLDEGDGGFKNFDLVEVEDLHGAPSFREDGGAGRNRAAGRDVAVRGVAGVGFGVVADFRGVDGGTKSPGTGFNAHGVDGHGPWGGCVGGHEEVPAHAAGFFPQAAGQAVAAEALVEAIFCDVRGGGLLDAVVA